MIAPAARARCARALRTCAVAYRAIFGPFWGYGYSAQVRAEVKWRRGCTVHTVDVCVRHGSRYEKCIGGQLIFIWSKKGKFNNFGQKMAILSDEIILFRVPQIAHGMKKATLRA